MAVFSDAEKIDVLIKSSFGVTSTDETLPWYNEVAEPFNQYTIGENILIDTIPSTPVFDTSRNPSDIGLSSSDFHSSNNDSSLDTCSIVDDSTGTVRRFRYLLLDPTTGTNNAGRSWTKKDTSGNNVLHNSLAFNYKKDGSYAPYESKLYRTNGSSPIQIGPSTGSWSYNTGTGILFFADYEEQDHVSTSNPPAFLVYVYIGQRGLGNFTVSSGGGGGGSGASTSVVDGAFSISGDLIVAQDIEANGGIIIQDDYIYDSSVVRLYSDARFEKLEVRDDLTVYGDISVNNFNVVKNVTFSGDITSDTLNTANIIQFDQTGTTLDVDLSGDVYRNSITTFGNIDAGGMIIANGDISANGKIIANGDISANGKIIANGDISANGILSVVGLQFNTINLTSLNITSINPTSGNLGIGTTSPASMLDVSGSMRAAYDSNTTSYFGRAAIGYVGHHDWAGFAHIDSNDTANFALLQNSSGKTMLNASSGQRIQFQINNSDKMVIDATGNVGIGTASPTLPLDVNGDSNFNGYISVVGGPQSINTSTTHGVHIGRYTSGGSYYGHIQMVSNNSGGSWIDWVDSTTGGTDYNGRLRYGIGAGFRFYTSQSERMRINTSGKVSIGGSSNPGANLDIGTSMDTGTTLYEAASIMLCHKNSSNDVGMGAIVGYHKAGTNNNSNGWPGGLLFKYKPANSNADKSLSDGMVLNANGQVGIGTTNPAHKLDLKTGTNYDGYILRNESNTLIGKMARSSTKGGYLSLYNSSGSSLISFNSTGNSYVNYGNLGLWTTSPSVRLHFVQGGRPGESTNSHGMRFANTNNSNYWGLFMSNNDHFRFVYKTSAKGYVDQNDSNRQMNFTGQHRTFVKNVSVNKVDSYTGLIVSSDQDKYIKMSGGIEKGNNAITINEALPVVSISKTEKDKKCFGVISNAEDEETRTSSSGRFVSQYDKELGDTRIYINSVGEGSIWVSNKNGNLESGDYITTSSVPGYGQKQDDDLLHNYTVAKITMNCDFQPQLIYKEQIKREFVNITTDPGNSPHDISGNYFVENTHEILYGKIRTIDASGNIEEGMISDYQNTRYILDIDASNNLISAQKNVLNENGEIQWENTTEQEHAYQIRHIDLSGNIITEEQYNTKIAAGEEAYIAAFVGCTYHCG